MQLNASLPPIWIVACLLACGSCAEAHRRPDPPAAYYPEGRTPPVDRVLTPVPKRQPAVPLHVRPDHPRLLVTDDDLSRVQSLIATDTTAADWFEALRRRADAQLNDRPEIYGHPMLGHSRSAYGRILLLSTVYRLTGDAKYADAVRRDLLAVCAFPDWQPDDFIATAEMMTAVAIGYDWTFDALSPSDRQTVREAIAAKGLAPGLAYYDKNKKWPRAANNWNLVCNGGLTVAALAVAGDADGPTARRLAEVVLGEADRSVANGLASYAPDGGWEEGPTYWNYATRYVVLRLAALQTAAGRAGELSRWPGLAKTGDFRIAALGPTRKTFNFADATEKPGTSPEMFWIARAAGRPADAAFERRLVKQTPDPLDLLWFTPADEQAIGRDVPTAMQFRGVGVAFLRSKWGDLDATYVGFKGGSDAASHGHLDAGTFVLDALGRRWAIQFGGDDYDLPGYFGDRREQYFRTGTRGQNTLLIDGHGQTPAGESPLTGFAPSPDAFAVADLTDAYRGRCLSLFRGVRLIGRRVLLQDDIALPRPSDLTWSLHTPADVSLDGSRATLTLGARVLEARILSPAGAAFEVVNDNPPPPEGQSPGVKNLRIRLKEFKAGRIAVLFTPAGASAEPPELRRLTEW